jgi:hypothetical protein
MFIPRLGLEKAVPVVQGFNNDICGLLKPSLSDNTLSEECFQESGWPWSVAKR